MQKNKRVNAAKMNGNLTQSRTWTSARNAIEMGTDTSNRVVITTRSLVPSLFCDEDMDACKAVDRRDTRIAPTLPGKPVLG